MQTLDRRERDSLRIDRRDRLVIVAQSKRPIEILRAWTNVAHVARFAVEAPRCDRQRRHTPQNGARIDRREGRLGGTIACARPDARTTKQLAARLK